MRAAARSKQHWRREACISTRCLPARSRRGAANRLNQGADGGTAAGMLSELRLSHTLPELSKAMGRSGVGPIARSKSMRADSAGVWL
jgi:hypothetical protein